MLADNTTLIPTSTIPCNSSLSASNITLRLAGLTLAHVALDESNASTIFVGDSTLIVTSSSSNITATSRLCSGYQAGKHYLEIASTTTRLPDRILMLIVKEGGEISKKVYTGSLLKLTWKSGALSVPPARCNSFPLELPSTRDLVVVVIEWGQWQDLVIVAPLALEKESMKEPREALTTSTAGQVINETVTLPPLTTREIETGRLIEPSKVRYAVLVVAGVLLYLVALRIERRT